MAAGLSYITDTLGIAPTVNGNTVSWPLPDLSLLETGAFTLLVAAPDTAVSSRYLVTTTLGTAGPEANPTDNQAVAEIMVSRQTFLPVVMRY